jgi:hypothetical protein
MLAMSKIRRASVAAMLLGSSTTSTAASYQSTMQQARGFYAAGNYAAAYTLLRTYRSSNAGQFPMDDLLGISACALSSLRASGRSYLIKLRDTVPPIYALSAADKSRLTSQIAVCSQTNAQPKAIPLAMLGAGSGSTSIPLPGVLLAAGADSKSDTMQQRLAREKLLVRSQKLQSAITAMPRLSVQIQGEGK